jgi:ABC-2 type transport system ATP-binding protein
MSRKIIAEPTSNAGTILQTQLRKRPESHVLLVKNLRKAYSQTIAVDGFSFGGSRNEKVGLLGPNGAGKTTNINMILGVLEPTAGTILIEDVDLARERSRAMGCTNFAAVYAPLPGNLTVEENLCFFGLLYGVKNLKTHIEGLLDEFELRSFRNSRSGVLFLTIP